jgi:hypothetical protein
MSLSKDEARISFFFPHVLGGRPPPTADFDNCGAKIRKAAPCGGAASVWGKIKNLGQMYEAKTGEGRLYSVTLFF